MPSKSYAYELTGTVLAVYRDAALENARLLLSEAKLLLEHGHFARAYFLSVSCIEESGKAALAHDGLRRDLTRRSVTDRLKKHFEDHSQKMTAAFTPWLQASPRPRSELQPIADIIVNVRFGREASMYTDVHRASGKVTTPSGQIRPIAASDCTRLAGHVLSRVEAHLAKGVRERTTRLQDEYFAMKSSHLKKILGSADFWEYYLHVSNSRPFEVVVLEYQQLYVARGRLFVGEAAGSSDA